MKLLTLARDLKRRKARDRQHLFVSEGVRATEELLRSRLTIRGALVAPQLAEAPRGAALRAALVERGVSVEDVEAKDFGSAAETESPQGIVAIAEIPSRSFAEIHSNWEGVVLVLDGVQDPGNVGAILRTAVAAGATGGVVAGVAADPFGSKAIRASAGAVFHLPLLFFPSASQAAAALHRHDVRVLVADPRGDRLESEVSYARPLALVFGSEGAGAARAWTPSAIRIRLPMAGAMESLGVAAAAAVLLYRAGAVAPGLGND